VALLTPYSQVLAITMEELACSLNPVPSSAAAAPPPALEAPPSPDEALGSVGQLTLALSRPPPPSDPPTLFL
jgi:hypothetical protein